jgi:hypothetical protein
MADIKTILKALNTLGLDVDIWSNVMNLKEGAHKNMYIEQYRKYNPYYNPDPNSVNEFIKIREAYEQVKGYTIKEIQNALKEDIHKEIHNTTGFDFKEADANTQEVVGNVVSAFSKLGLHF